MASLIPGYEYDIFISYRQKDNKGDRWVSEFVEALKVELESTFKEEISVYFDVNPHDGLLETHDVDASLKEKLKCLIFIPIISRTYCDPKSFAWEHEFKAFVELASHDQFGLKIKLPNGNVTTRVLSVQIHDLNPEDKALVQQALGGYLRPVEFIYKEPGVNKPLTSEDDEKRNLNNTKYRIQVNKVANAIDEIIRGLKSNQTALVNESTRQSEYSEENIRDERRIGKGKPVSIKIPKWLSGIAFLAFIVIAGILVYPKIFKKDKLAKLRTSDGKISVAVMPFQNMTNDSTWNVWQDGIQNELINDLTNSEELKVRQTESISAILQSKRITNYASLTPSVASNLSQKLDANVLIYGSIKQAGQTIRLNAQLINSKTEESFKSFQIDGTPESILHIVDSLSVELKDYLIISKLKKELTPDFQNFASTNSPEAYKYFIYAQKVFMNRDMPAAREWILKALAADSNFYAATMVLSVTYGNQNLYDQAKKLCLKLYQKREKLPVKMRISANWLHAAYFESPLEEIEYIKQILEIDDQSAAFYWQLGNAYQELYLYDKAIPEFEKALDIYDKWGLKPMWLYSYTSLGRAYHKTGQYAKEKEIYKKAEMYFPGDPDLIFMQSIMYLTLGDTIEAHRCVQKFISVCRNNGAQEADLSTKLSWIYSQAGINDNAEKYLRQSLLLEPTIPDRLNNLAYFLIDKDRNINEGIELANRAIKMNPDDYNFLHTKGWGLFKQHKYEDALKLLKKSWDLKPIYDHHLYLHIEEVKKVMGIPSQI